METIIHYKWIILIAFEVLAWLSTFLMFYFRYFLNSKILFRIATGFGIVTGIIPQISLAVISVVEEQKIDLFVVVILLLLIYGFTFGKKHIKKLDLAVKKWADSKKRNLHSSDKQVNIRLHKKIT